MSVASSVLSHVFVFCQKTKDAAGAHSLGHVDRMEGLKPDLTTTLSQVDKARNRPVEDGGSRFVNDSSCKKCSSFVRFGLFGRLSSATSSGALRNASETTCSPRSFKADAVETEVRTLRITELAESMRREQVQQGAGTSGTRTEMEACATATWLTCPGMFIQDCCRKWTQQGL